MAASMSGMTIHFVFVHLCPRLCLCFGGGVVVVVVVVVGAGVVVVV